MPIFAFAAAKDGDVFLSSLEADDIESATTAALTAAGVHFGFDVGEYPEDHEDGVPCDHWFGGFEICPLSDLSAF